jgi:DNA-binding NtrC family response regulator
MKQKITVLIVEDSSDDYFLLEEVLTSAEEVEAVILHESRLDGAFSAAENGKIDVAIIDLALPDSFGLDTFLAFHQRHPTIPTIIMTGAKDQEMAFLAVGKGAQDYLFKGEPSSTAIIRSIRYAIERQRLMSELRNALDHVKQLQEMLPICAICKNIRDDKGYWNSIEAYISDHTDTVFSHSICPVCAQKHYKEFLRRKPGE